MKHIKKVNEYNRTIGFRYSDPKKSYDVTCKYVGDSAPIKFTKEMLDKVLKHVSNLKYSNIESITTPGVIQTPNGDIAYDGVVKFEIMVYDQKEIESILDDFSRISDVMFDIVILSGKTKESIKNFE